LCAELYNKNVLVFYTWPIIDFVNPWNIPDFTLLYIYYGVICCWVRRMLAAFRIFK